MSFLLLLVFFSLIIFYARRLILNYSRLFRFALRIPTVPGALPLIGHLHLKAFKDNTGLFSYLCDISQQTNEEDGIKKLWLGPIPLFLTTDPDAYRDIANTCLDKSNLYKIMDTMLGGGIFLVEGSLWKRRIKVVRPAFTSKEIVNFLPVFNENSRLLVKDLEREVGLGAFKHRQMVCYAILKMIFGDVSSNLNAVSEAAFGSTPEKENVSCQEYKTYVERAENCFMEHIRHPWLQLDFFYRLSALRKEEEKITDFFFGISKKVLKRAKEAYAKRGDSNTDVRFKTFLELLLKNSAEGAISDDHMRAELDTIILTGTQTKTLAVVLTLMLLGAHPESQEKVYKELKQIYGDTDRDVTKEDLTRMVYLEAAIKESLRIYPSVPITARQMDRDMKFKQYTLPAGATVLLSHWGVSRRKCWGNDVEQFKPERWLDRSTLPDGLILDNIFGIGIRSCVGKIYAMVSMKTMLAHILRRYKVTASTEDIQFQFAVILQTASELAISVELR